MVAHYDLDLNQGSRGCNPSAFTAELSCYPKYAVTYWNVIERTFDLALIGGLGFYQLCIIVNSVMGFN